MLGVAEQSIQTRRRSLILTLMRSLMLRNRSKMGKKLTEKLGQIVW